MIYNCCGDKDTTTNDLIYLPDTDIKVVVTRYVLVNGDLHDLYRVTAEEKVNEIKKFSFKTQMS